MIMCLRKRNIEEISSSCILFSTWKTWSVSLLYLSHDAAHTDKPQLYSTGVAVLTFVNFADKKVADGTMKKSRLILPGQRRLKKWILSIGREDSPADNETPDSMESGANHVYMGPRYSPKKDPEHLPPKNAWERFGNGIKKISKFLGSAESAFGLRVSCATMTIGILAYLERTQTFFETQRLVWAMIIIAISMFAPRQSLFLALTPIGMNMTSGQSIFGFLARVSGTVIAMVISFAIWYIPDQHTVGVIVFLWLFIFIEMYFFLKFPRFVPVWLVCIVTQVLIIGYELQVRKIGIKASTAIGQPYYPYVPSHMLYFSETDICNYKCLRTSTLPTRLRSRRFLCCVHLDDLPLPYLRPELVAQRPRSNTLPVGELLQCSSFDHWGKGQGYGRRYGE